MPLFENIKFCGPNSSHSENVHSINNSCDSRHIWVCNSRLWPHYHTLQKSRWLFYRAVFCFCLRGRIPVEAMISHKWSSQSSAPSSKSTQNVACWLESWYSPTSILYHYAGLFGLWLHPEEMMMENYHFIVLVSRFSWPFIVWNARNLS